MALFLENGEMGGGGRQYTSIRLVGLDTKSIEAPLSSPEGDTLVLGVLQSTSYAIGHKIFLKS